MKYPAYPYLNAWYCDFHCKADIAMSRYLDIKPESSMTTIILKVEDYEDEEVVNPFSKRPCPLTGVFFMVLSHSIRYFNTHTQLQNKVLYIIFKQAFCIYIFKII